MNVAKFKSKKSAQRESSRALKVVEIGSVFVFGWQAAQQFVFDLQHEFLAFEFVGHAFVLKLRNNQFECRRQLIDFNT